AQLNPVAVFTQPTKVLAAWSDYRAGAGGTAWANQYVYTQPAFGPGVTDFTATQRYSIAILLGWTVPANDPTYGPATGFDVRMSTTPIVDFEAATRVRFFTNSSPPGTPYCATATPLTKCRTYYFAIKPYYGCEFEGTQSLTTASTLCTGNTTDHCDPFFSLRPAPGADGLGQSLSMAVGPNPV